LRPGIYVDDIYLSGDIEPQRLKKLLVRIISDAGFRVSEEKLDLHYARRSHERQEGPGTVLNRKVNVPKAFVRQVRSALYRCRTKGIAGQVLNDKTADGFRLSLMGKIQHVRWINPTAGDKLLADFHRIDWEPNPRAGRS
jgi:RNA-directed DNA polymerase